MAMHYAEAVGTVERIIYPPTVHIDNEQIKDLKKMELNQKVTLKGKIIEYTTRNPEDGRPIPLITA